MVQLPDLVHVRRVWVDAGEDGAPERVAVAPGRIGRPEVVGGAIDRVKVHGRLPCRHLGAEPRVGLDGLVGDLLDEVGAPVPLVALRVDLVEGALQRRVRHRLHAVKERLGQELEQRSHRLRRLLLAADVAPDDPADLAQVDLLRERRRRAARSRRRRTRSAPAGRSAGTRGRPRGPRRPPRPARRSGRRSTVPTSCSRNRNEVTTPKLPPPPLIAQYRSGFSSALARTRSPLGEHQLGLEQVVDREPALAGQVAEAAAEREAADPGGRDDPARRREPVLVGRAVDLAPGTAAADANGARLRIDLDVSERREVDHDAVVTRPQPGAVVAAAADGQQQVVIAGEGDGLGDVVRRPRTAQSTPAACRSSRCRPCAPRRSRRLRVRSAGR